MKTTNTVLGPVEINELGVTLMYEHLLGSTAGIPQVYPELLGKDFKERILKGLKAAAKESDPLEFRERHPLFFAIPLLFFS